MKTNKRTLAILTAGLLAVSPMAVGMTVFAEAEAGDSTISISDPDTILHTYKAYQIITGEQQTGVLKNLEWGSAIPAANRAPFITGLNGLLNLTGDDAIATTANVQTVAEALSTVTDPDDKIALAKLIAQYVDKANEAITMSKSESTYSAENLADGWYLILDETNPLASATTTASTQVRSANILKLVGDTNINYKHSLPTLEKKIVEGETKKDANTAAIGDAVNYNIEIKVPDVRGYNKYFYIVEDTLSAGLDYNDDMVVQIVGETDPLDMDTDGPVASEDSGNYYVTTDGTNIKVVFVDAVNLFKNKTPGTKINITYSATLNENANIDPNEGNPNEAKLVYSNDPSVTYKGKTDDNPSTPDYPDEPNPGDPDNPENPADVTGETPKDKVNTYTTAIKIKKVDQDGQPLAGATFTLEGTALNQVAYVSGTTFEIDDTTPGTYWRLKTGSYTTVDPATLGLTAAQVANYADDGHKYKKVEGSTSTLTAEGSPKSITATVDAEGYLTFTGLNAGAYTLVETGVPSGYNKAANISFTIGASPIDEYSVTWTKDSAQVGAFDTEENLFPVTVENRKGATLPSTGGMGTRLFYIIGGLLVAGSLVLLVTKKRMGAKEN